MKTSSSILLAMALAAPTFAAQKKISELSDTNAVHQNARIPINIVSGSTEITKTITASNLVESLKLFSNWESGGSGSAAWDEITDKPDVLTNGHTAPITFSNATLIARGNVQVDGDVTASSFFGIGSGLTSLNADQISSGTLADARIASTLARDSEVAAAYQPLDSDLTTVANSTPGNSKYFGTDGSGAKGFHDLPTSGGGGGGGLSNTIPSFATYTGTNIFLNASAATFFDITLTNHAILNVTNTSPSGFTNGELRTVRLRRDGLGAWQVYITNTTAIKFGEDLGPAVGFGSIRSNATTYVGLRRDSLSNWWDVVQNPGGYNQ